MSDAYLDRMAELGVLDEADEYFDAIERGENPCADGVDVEDVIRRARQMFADNDQ